jgi:hypothetical protein
MYITTLLTIMCFVLYTSEMTISGTKISLPEAARLFPKRNGKAPHIKSIRRRILHGCRGVKLRAVKDGGLWLTTADWIEQFQQACTRQAMPTTELHPEQHPEQHSENFHRAKERLSRRYGEVKTEEVQTLRADSL